MSLDITPETIFEIVLFFGSILSILFYVSYKLVKLGKEE